MRAKEVAFINEKLKETYLKLKEGKFEENYFLFNSNNKIESFI